MSAPTKTPPPTAAGATGAASVGEVAAAAETAGTGYAGRSGRLAEEYAALRRGCGLAAPSTADGADTMEMVGPDRHRFLNAYVTCEVKGLTVGQGTRSEERR